MDIADVAGFLGVAPQDTAAAAAPPTAAMASLAPLGAFSAQSIPPPIAGGPALMTSLPALHGLPAPTPVAPPASGSAAPASGGGLSFKSLVDGLCNDPTLSDPVKQQLLELGNTYLPENKTSCFTQMKDLAGKERIKQVMLSLKRSAPGASGAAASAAADRPPKRGTPDTQQEMAPPPTKRMRADQGAAPGRSGAVTDGYADASASAEVASTGGARTSLSSEVNHGQAAGKRAVTAKRAAERAAEMAAMRAATAPPLTSEEALQQAQAEGRTLIKAESKTETNMGYYGVRFEHSSKTRPYEARVLRGGKSVTLGCFANAEEAALCVARSPEGNRAATAPPQLTSEEAVRQALADGLTLRVAGNNTGYRDVVYLRGKPNPYRAKAKRDGHAVHLGSFATAEQAALCVARSPEGQAAAEKAAAAPTPLTSEEALQQAQAEGLTLRVSGSKSGYYGVGLTHPGYPKPYQTQVTRGGKLVHLGSFATAEEAALCIARSLAGQAAAELAAAVPPPPVREDEGSGEAPAVPSAAVLKQESVAPLMPSGAAVVKVEDTPPAPLMPFSAIVKEEQMVPPMPPALRIVKLEHAIVND